MERLFDDFVKAWRWGRTTRFTITVTEVDENGVEQPVDLTSYRKLLFTAKRSLEDLDANAAIRLDNAGLGGVTATAGGKMTVEIPGSARANVPNQHLRLWAEASGEDSGGTPWSLSQGIVKVDPTVTGNV